MSTQFAAQEVAGNHAVGMWGRTDKGFANLPSMKDLIFVMTRLQIRIDEYPRWCAPPIALVWPANSRLPCRLHACMGFRAQLHAARQKNRLERWPYPNLLGRMRSVCRLARWLSHSINTYGVTLAAAMWVGCCDQSLWPMASSCSRHMACTV